MNIAGFIANGTPEILIEAIILTKRRFEEDPPDGLKSESDRWVYDLGHYRPTLIKAVKVSWAEITCQPEFECPFTDDRIVHMWVCCRKNSYTLDRLVEDLKKVRRDGGLFA